MRRAWLGLVVLCTLPAAFCAPALGATASWEFDTPSYDFGPVLPGSGPTEPHKFVLTNTGDTTLGVAGYGVAWGGEFPLDPGLFHIDSSDCGFLQPEESCSIGIVFNPLMVGPKHGSLHAATATGEPAPASVDLSGEGAGPWVSITPEHLHFEAVEVGKGPSPRQTITVENQGSLDLTIEGISLTNFFGGPQSPSPFQVVGGSCQAGLVVASHTSCSIEVVLAPWEEGFFRSRIQIADDAPGSPHEVEVQGAGTAPPAKGGGATVTVIMPKPEKTPPRGGVSDAKPTVRITRHPARFTARRSATFGFSTTPAAASKECELDRLGFKPCSAPVRYAQLSTGRHEFRVRARSSGAFGSVVARFSWRVKRWHGDE